MVHKVVNFQKSGKGELMLRNIKEFLMRLTPKISFSVDPANEMSVSLGIAPEDYSPEEILQLPEKIAHPCPQKKPPLIISGGLCVILRTR